jgi:hypothetical protein
MANPIVNVTVSQQIAPAPSTLQKSGALISQGGTNTSPGTKSLLTQDSSLTSLLAAPLALSALSWSGGIATATAAATTIASGTYNEITGLVTLTLTAPIGLAVGSPVVVSGVTGTGSYADVDGSYVAAVGSGGMTLEYTIATTLTLTITGGTVTLGHGITVGDQFLTTIAGAVPSNYDGTFLATSATATTFTYQLASDGGTSPATGTITYTPRGVVELSAMAGTFFDQGTAQAVWVLELGPGEPSAGVSFLTTWIAANPGVFYSYLVPRSWDGVGAFLTMLAGFEATTSKTNFFITTTLATYKLYTALMKCAFTLIEAPAYGVWPANVLTALSQISGVATAVTTTNHGVQPGQWFQLSGNLPSGWNGWFLALPGTATNSITFDISSSIGAETQLGTLVTSYYSSAGVPATEFSCAAPFQVTLDYAPASSNRVTPLNLSYLFGVTPFPTQGNSALLTTINTANVNVIGTGAQGGISNTVLIGGNMMDGNPFNYWYSVDWFQITGQQAVTAVLINGSNNPQNPVYYDQAGINALQGALVTVANNGISYGLVLNPVQPTQFSAAAFEAALDAGTFNGYTAVNADPFASYVAENPNDYATGTYNGLSVDYVPLRGFESITINITVSNFAS